MAALGACVQALLQMESVRDTEFEPEVLACLPPMPWSISAAEISKRRDLRDTRQVVHVSSISRHVSVSCPAFKSRVIKLQHSFSQHRL